MSSPTPPLQPTRQQLDELEALMQRMLALPVNQLDAGADDELTLPALAPIDLPPVWESEPAAPVRETPPAKNGAPKPTNGKAEPATVALHEPAASERPNVLELEENLRPVAANLTIVHRAATPETPWRLPTSARRVPVPLRPLVWVNRAFDRVVGLFGAPGRWLRGARGRAAIGWAGLVMFAAAAAWAFLEWMGWTW